MPILRYENYNIDYEITQRRKNQKNIVLRFRDGTLTVSAPKRATHSQIETVLIQNVTWIQSRIQESQKKLVQRDSQDLSLNEIYLFGKPYPVVICLSEESDVQLKENFVISEENAKIFVPKSMEQTSGVLNAYIHRVIYQSLFSLAQTTIPNIVMNHGNQFHLKPIRVMVKEQKSRWGSCSINRSIYMNWRLIQAPEEVINYVAIHELAHLQEHNHSTRFWDLVEQMMPDYKMHRTWLKRHGEKLFFIRR